MDRQHTQSFKIEMIKAAKKFYVENGLDQEELKYFLGLLLCDIGFIADYYDEDLFNYSRAVSKS